VGFCKASISQPVIRWLVEPPKSKYLAAFNLLDSPGGSALQSYDPTLNQVSNSMHSYFPASAFDTLDLNMEAFCDIVCKLKAR
jgi:hypothetical protein